MSDQIADMLTRIRNGYMARKISVLVPYSRQKQAVAGILVEEGFLAKMETEGKTPAEKKLRLTLKYHRKEPAVTKLIRVSKPGRRVYCRADKIPAVRYGFGVTILSSSSGIITDKQAKKLNLGGEVICQVW
jgi:small subunit ribosomal protein S8